MNLVKALIAVSKGKKVTCPNWECPYRNYFFQDLLGNLVYYDGYTKKTEPVGADTLACWITQNASDWYLLEEQEVGIGSGVGHPQSGHTEP